MSVCETTKMTSIRTMTILSESIHSAKQACLFPQTLCPIHFFPDGFYLIMRSFISRDTSFLKKASDRPSTPALCVFVFCF